jgi:soluble lytic murein transglycosylase
VRRVAFLDNITAQSESHGDPNAVSPKGARGLMQVMPSTARNPGFGIAPSNGTAADDVRVGREYRAVMQRRYGGDLSKMWGAYNWGPGNLDNALARHGPDWLNHAPPETQNYVRRNLRAIGG